MTDETKEERRRRQNRENQARFRARHPGYYARDARLARGWKPQPSTYVPLPFEVARQSKEAQAEYRRKERERKAKDRARMKRNYHQRWKRDPERMAQREKTTAAWQAEHRDRLRAYGRKHDAKRRQSARKSA